MNRKNDLQRRITLQEKYKFLEPTDLREGLMAFGFECGDGWLEILEDLFEKIDIEITKNPVKDFRVFQVKEKFGGLRVYTNFIVDEVERLIKEAEKEAAKTCENCGKSGKNRDIYGWLSTLCEDCFEERTKGK
jgi:hypothetical protein